MKLSQFDFELPQEMIATELMPEIDGHVQWRDECKLMVLHKDTGEIEHRRFKDIIDYFGKGDRFVLNDMLGSRIQEAVDKLVDGLVDASEGRVPQMPGNFNL